MKEKNKLYFMELMGDIDDRMIQEAATPWENSRVSAWHKRSRQAAAVAAVVLLGMGCLLHTEVRAGIDKATTWIRICCFLKLHHSLQIRKKQKISR